MIPISTFDDLLQAARLQPERQRLLFVFAAAELPEDCTPAQRARFEAGQGGALTPLMCADKTPEEIATFHALVEESRQFEREWSVVFVAALSGRDGRAPSSEDAQKPLERMVESLKAGSPGPMIAFDRQGQALSLS
jgi:hypothetical protein